VLGKTNGPWNSSRRSARLLTLVAALLAGLPVVAIGRGIVELVLGGHDLASPGLLLSIVAILLGAFFFAYSVRYYVATLLVLLLGESRSRALGATAQVGATPEGLWNGGWRPEPGLEPKVCVQIASYNEARVIERLLEACTRLTYPNYEVILCDDSNDPEVLRILERWQRRPGFKILHRDHRTGYKGGALRAALTAMDPAVQYVMLLDADAIPFPDAIERFLPRFYRRTPDGGFEPRPRIAAIQSYQWHVLNKDEGFITGSVRAEYAGSYMVERVLEELTGALRMIAGTAYVIRAEVLKELGWGTSITEDWELTLRLYERGYKVGYTPYAEVPAECVSSFGRLVRQRMRWAEGHTHQVKRHFWPILRSPHLTLTEKAEFVYFAPYYLQSIPLVIGTLAWVLSDFVLHSHLPEWTAVMGWSLVGTNLLALPLMNVGGLLLEQAPARDLRGVLGAWLVGTLLTPFQGWAALKGLLEKREGPWFRTPKTGRTTGTPQRIPRLGRLKRRLEAAGASAAAQPAPALAAVAVTDPAAARPRRFRASHLAWAPISLALALLGVLTAGALHSPVAYASPVAEYLHGSSPYTMDSLAPRGGGSDFKIQALGDTRTWVSSSYPAGTVVPAGIYDFNYWITANGAASATVLQAFGYSANGCTLVVPIVSWTTTYTNANDQHTTATTAIATTLPVGGPYDFCWTVTATAVTGQGVGLSYDSNLKQTNLGTPSIVLAESPLPAAGLALLAPLAAAALLGRRRRSRP
jgi:cellulose synthase/poly-beta-1,6-N-acetylglucosamine synthase-like glycosyltransferase